MGLRRVSSRPPDSAHISRWAPRRRTNLVFHRPFVALLLKGSVCHQRSEESRPRELSPTERQQIHRSRRSVRSPSMFSFCSPNLSAIINHTAGIHVEVQDVECAAGGTMKRFLFLIGFVSV